MSQPIDVRASLSGRDEVHILETEGSFEWRVIGCRGFLNEVYSFAAGLKGGPASWPLPAGESHAQLLLREVVLKARGEWSYPYAEKELCHCRLVPTERVDRAIVAGAHSAEAVKQQTSASSACGTCRFSIEAIIDFRLGKKAHQSAA